MNLEVLNLFTLRDVFYEAEKHIYELMKKNSYPRFAQSELYKELLANAIIPAPKRRLVFPMRVLSLFFFHLSIIYKNEIKTKQNNFLYLVINKKKE